MLSSFSANQLRIHLQRERAIFARALGRKRQAHEKAREKAQRACAYLQQAGQLLVSQGLPAAWDVRVQPVNTYRPGAMRVEMTLDGADLGRFLVNDDWFYRYWVADRDYLFFFRHCAPPAATWRARSPITSCCGGACSPLPNIYGKEPGASGVGRRWK